MRIFYLTGQSDFGNRGCEALVRSTVAQLRGRFPDGVVMVPSADPAKDAGQWPEAAASGVRFVARFRSPHNKYWRYVQALPLPFAKRLGWPFPIADEVKRDLESADAVLSIGGDNYSLDYMIPSMLMGQDAYAMDTGTPVVLWGASVGPFSKDPDFERYVRSHLARMGFIGARETETEAYLKNELALDNVKLVADPAFGLEPEPVDMSSFWPADTTDVLGFNVSPLIERYRPDGEASGKLLDEVAAFLREVSDRYGVLLVSHVVPLDGRRKNNDSLYLEGLLQRLHDVPTVKLMDPTLNAAQTKFVMSRCCFFIGARTHATIGALSSCVPTGSIAYSVKAKGINKDLFGHTRFVLETPHVSAITLAELLARLESEEAEVRSELQELMPRWRDRARANVDQLARLLDAWA